MTRSTTLVNNDADNSLLRCSAQPRGTIVSVFTLILLPASAAALRFLFLARKRFWFDECFSVEVTRLSWHDFGRLLWRREANMSLYYLLLRAWLHFGSSPFFIRSLSVVISFAALPAVYWLACKLFDRRVALLAAALMSFNAYHIRYAQEARSYSLFVLLATLSRGFFVASLREPSRRKRLGYIFASVLAVYAHLCALLLLAAQWLAVRRTRERICSRALRHAWIWIAVASLPLLIFAAKTGAGPIRWIQRPGLRDLVEFAERIAGNDGLPLLLLYAVACLAAIIPLGKMTRLFPTEVTSEIWSLRFLLIWLLFPVALTVVMSLARPVFLGRYFIFCLPALVILAAAGLAKLRRTWLLAGWRGGLPISVVMSLARPVFLGRYFIFCLPALVILAAAGLAKLRRTWLLAGWLAAMLLLSLQGTFSYYNHDFDLERDDAEGAANYVLDHAQLGDAILFHIAEARVPYEFFKSIRANVRSGIGVDGPEIIYPRHGDRLDYQDFTGKPSGELVQSASGHHSRVWVVLMSNGTLGHPDATTVMLNQTLGESFPRVERVQFPQVEVRLYSRP